uniref:Ribosomal protein L32 n=1 Tax=Caulerpa cliftonii TaxID=1004391 RepID=A0A1C9JBV6_9CHLO|nr:ribosomal protein L32 [Caulerpa cliftonii]AOP19339.1 ribosomal protein L32 [Caulerpa cliftonii]
MAVPKKRTSKSKSRKTKSLWKKKAFKKKSAKLWRGLSALQKSQRQGAKATP